MDDNSEGSCSGSDSDSDDDKADTAPPKKKAKQVLISSLFQRKRGSPITSPKVSVCGEKLHGDGRCQVQVSATGGGKRHHLMKTMNVHNLSESRMQALGLSNTLSPSVSTSRVRMSPTALHAAANNMIQEVEMRRAEAGAARKEQETSSDAENRRQEQRQTNQLARRLGMPQRRQYTLSQKVNIGVYLGIALNIRRVSVRNALVEVNKVPGLEKVASSMASRWIGNIDKYKAQLRRGTLEKVRRMVRLSGGGRPLQYAQFEPVLFEKFKKKRHEGVLVTTYWLRVEMAQLASLQQLPTRAWARAFKRRYRITRRAITNRKTSDADAGKRIAHVGVWSRFICYLNGGTAIKENLIKEEEEEEEGPGIGAAGIPVPMEIDSPEERADAKEVELQRADDEAAVVGRADYKESARDEAGAKDVDQGEFNLDAEEQAEAAVLRLLDKLKTTMMAAHPELANQATPMWGTFSASERLNCDQVGINFLTEARYTLEIKGNKQVRVKRGKDAWNTKRFATVTLTTRPPLDDQGERVYGMPQAKPSIIFKGARTTERGTILAREGHLYSDKVHVHINPSAWADDVYCLEYVEEVIGPLWKAECERLDNDHRFLLLSDNIKAQFNMEFKKAVERNGGWSINLPPNLTDLLQPVDRGMGAAFKVFMRESVDQYLLDGDSELVNEIVSGTAEVSKCRVILTYWVAEAAEKCFEMAAQVRWWENSGLLLAIDGSNFQKVRVEGATNFPELLCAPQSREAISTFQVFSQNQVAAESKANAVDMGVSESKANDEGDDEDDNAMTLPINDELERLDDYDGEESDSDDEGPASISLSDASDAIAQRTSSRLAGHKGSVVPLAEMASNAFIVAEEEEALTWPSTRDLGARLLPMSREEAMVLARDGTDEDGYVFGVTCEVEQQYWWYFGTFEELDMYDEDDDGDEVWAELRYAWYGLEEEEAVVQAEEYRFKQWSKYVEWEGDDAVFAAAEDQSDGREHPLWGRVGTKGAWVMFKRAKVGKRRRHGRFSE
ncbi:MAG: hypothetical protein JKX76_00510 [Colwellia sp.]|nr:hypothetical protein [Colwellia sp.]